MSAVARHGGSRRRAACFLALAAALALPARAAETTQTGAPAPTPTPAKHKHPIGHQVVRRWHGYGFLPGYVPPELEPPRRDYFTHPPTWWYGGPGFYRGRWNGGGFGPCWTQTPIGPMWNCGR
ncbi:MAG TPA: hypothetical protein VII40_04240 [Xanthobacteraceae bacterium]